MVPIHRLRHCWHALHLYLKGDKNSRIKDKIAQEIILIIKEILSKCFTVKKLLESLKTEYVYMYVCIQKNRGKPDATKEFKGFIHDKTVDQVITLNSYD